MITAYAIIGQLNAKLAELGVDKVCPPQMGYNYARKGMINGVKGAKTFTQDEANAWIAKYLQRNGYIEAVTTIAVPDNDGTQGEW